MSFQQLAATAGIGTSHGIPKKVLSTKIAEAKARVAVDDALYRYRTEVPEELAMPKPVLTEEAVNPELQHGESSLLGGAMELKSPWSNN